MLEHVTSNNTSIIKYPIEKVAKIMKSMSIINDNLSYCNNSDIQI